MLRLRRRPLAALVLLEVEDPMFTRRELLTRGTTMLLLIPIVSCSSSGDDGGGSCAGVETTSTVNADHTHTVCVLTTNLTTPPATVTYTTSNVGSHTHTVMLTMAQLTMINGGQTVTVTSSTDPDPINGMAHSHDFMIKKM
jgi:hypothetical protein